MSHETVLAALPYAKTKQEKLDHQADFATKGIEALKRRQKSEWTALQRPDKLISIYHSHFASVTP